MKSKSKLQAQVDFEWDTASVPLFGGVDLRSNRKLRAPNSLTELNNARWVERGSIRKRAGHLGARLAADNFYGWYSGPAEQSDVEWVYGLSRAHSNSGAAYHPRQAKGVFTLNDTLVGWTGDRLYTQNADGVGWSSPTTDFFGAPNGNGDLYGFPGFFPTSQEKEVIFGVSEAEDIAVAQGYNFRVTAWRSGTSVYIKVENHLTGQTLYSREEVSGASNNPAHVRCIYLDGQILVIWNDTVLNELHWVKVHDQTGAITAAALLQGDVSAGGTGQPPWDFAKKDDDTCLLVWFTVAHDIKGKIINGYGSVTTTLASPTTFDQDGHAATVAANDRIACAIHSTGRILLMWTEGGTATPPLRVRAYQPDGTASGVSGELIAAATQVRFTCGAGFFENTKDTFAAAATTVTGLYAHVTKFYRMSNDGSGGDLVDTRYQVQVAGKMFTVGDVYNVLVTSRHLSTAAPVQSNYFMANWGFLSKNSTTVKVRISAVFSRGEAALCAGGAAGVESGLLTFDFLPGQGSTTQRFQWIGLLSEREDNWTADTGAVTGSVETKGRLVLLTYLPKLRWAQAGQLVYIAGSCVQLFDGVRVTEAGFYEFPEITSIAIGAPATGSLTAGDYRYRAYFCKRAANGVVFRSPSLTSGVATANANGSLTPTITTLSMTNDPDVYYELYRTEAGGTVYYLCSGYNPASATKNSLAAASITILDTLADSVLRTMPLDPFVSLANGELEESAPPGCEIISYINDRLWLAGGSIEAGKLVYSKSMEIGEGVGFSDLGVLEYSVDRTGKEITAIGQLMSMPVIFRERDVFLVSGDGPDNFGLSSFALPRFLSTDLGAVSQEGIVSCPLGLAYVSAAGPRLIDNSLQVQNIGDEVYPLMSEFDCTGAVLVAKDSQIRFYGRGEKALVWDYTLKQWTIYTGLACEGVCLVDGVPALAKADGMIMVETEGVWTDAGDTYEFSGATADLAASDLKQGAIRFRRWALMGDWLGDHQLLVEIFKNGGNILAERFEWDPDTDTSFNLWGTGSGTFGLAGSTIWPDETKASKDGIYRTRRRFKATTQKASMIRMRFSDQGAASEAFVATELALEIGIKPGLSRLPARTFTAQ